jgi:hypothetical protein
VLTQAAEVARKVLRANQGERPMHEAEEDAKESPFIVVLIDVA